MIRAESKPTKAQTIRVRVGIFKQFEIVDNANITQKSLLIQIISSNYHLLT